MSKQEVFLNVINEKYKGIKTIIDSDEYNEEDVKWFIRFRDSDRLHNTFDDWLAYRQLVNKIKRVGINGVLMHSAVNGTSVGVEDDGRGGIIKYIVVDTIYGKVWVGANGKQVVYIR
jgi:hypothetical protein